MATDIKLSERIVEVEGDVLNAKTYDFMLDSPERRSPSTSTSEYRRALVHNVGDKLTINYAGDYPGGVEIEGITRIKNLTVGVGLLFEPLGVISNVLGIAGVPGDEGVATIGFLAQDLHLINKSAEGANLPPGKNVALSHMPGDKLVINRGEGYEGGVTIEGNVEVADGLTVKGKGQFDADLTVGNLQIHGSEVPHTLFQVHPHRKLAIYSDAILVTKGSTYTHTFDLVDAVEKLQERVAALEAQLVPHP